MAQSVQITPADLEAMVQHWCATEPNGYLGSTYGTELEALLQNPMGAGLADAFLAKMREDLPIIASLGANAVDVYFQNVAPDKKQLIIAVAGRAFTIGG